MNKIRKPKIGYHVTKKRNLKSILENGLKCDYEENFLTGNDKTKNLLYKSYQGITPIFFSLSPLPYEEQERMFKFFQTEFVEFKINVEKLHLCSDIGALILDNEAYYDEEYNEEDENSNIDYLYWQEYPNDKIESYCIFNYPDEKIPIYDLLNWKNTITKYCIELTKTFATIDDVRSKRIIDYLEF